ncbi:MAG: MaoC family dehydratase [bacterium]
MSDFSENMSYVSEAVIDQSLVKAYAELLGDKNPLHLDSAFAATTKFGKPIAHGGILFGLVSRILGMEFPGPGTVYLSQLMNFHKPVFIGERLRFHLCITELLPKDGASIRVKVTNTAGELVADGEAKIKLPSWCLLRKKEALGIA